MPNNNPFGFRHTGLTSGGSHRLTTFQLKKLAGNTDVFYTGDALAADANGGICRTFTPGTTPILAISDGKYVASTEAYINAIFTAQGLFVTQASGTLNETHVNNNANVLAGTGNATTNASGDTLDVSTLATTNTLDLKVWALERDKENAFGSYARVIVSFNKAGIGSGIVGV